MNDACRAVCPDLPEGWRWCRSEAIGEGAHTLYRVTGAVCPRVTRGPRAGRVNWARRDRSTERTIVITRAQLDAAARGAS